jgi:hypothetical protein
VRYISLTVANANIIKLALVLTDRPGLRSNSPFREEGSMAHGSEDTSQSVPVVSPFPVLGLALVIPSTVLAWFVHQGLPILGITLTVTGGALWAIRSGKYGPFGDLESKWTVWLHQRKPIERQHTRQVIEKLTNILYAIYGITLLLTTILAIVGYALVRSDEMGGVNLIRIAATLLGFAMSMLCLLWFGSTSDQLMSSEDTAERDIVGFGAVESALKTWRITPWLCATFFVGGYVLTIVAYL